MMLFLNVVIHFICVFAKIQKFGFICIEGDVKFLAKMICYTGAQKKSLVEKMTVEKKPDMF